MYVLIARLARRYVAAPASGGRSGLVLELRGRSAVVVVFDGFLEFFEDGVEVGEDAVVAGAFLEHVVEQADADYEFFGVFFGDVAFFVGSFYHGGEVVVAAEVEVHDFLNFTVDHFGDVEVVGAFFIVGFTVAVHNI